jgi:hypothetical protein
MPGTGKGFVAPTGQCPDAIPVEWDHGVPEMQSWAIGWGLHKMGEYLAKHAAFDAYLTSVR